jgi:glycosyltransferase involved in cell wall biosynthesis
MKIFIAATSFQSSYGGPARSVSRLADELSDLQCEIGLWSADGSVMETSFLRERSSIRRLAGSIDQALAGYGMPDVVHDNGIWLPHNHRLAGLCAKKGIPRVVSVRGMLEPWARHHKRLKKWIAWQLYQRSDLARATCHHVTSGAEAKSVREFGWNVPIREIPNGVDVPAASIGEPRVNGPRIALFVGRIHPVKGIPMLVEAWNRVRPEGWKLRIAGPDEGGHRAKLEAMIDGANLSAICEWTGELGPEEKAAAYRCADLFVLPSHTENFGMVIGEAMGHGLPVLTTQGTPWQLLQTERCGWWAPVTVDGIADALEDATSKSPMELGMMGERGRAVMIERFSWSRVATEFVDCYKRAKG